MFVEAVMTSPVISIEATMSIKDAARLMLARRVSGLPVVSKRGGLVGMISEADFLRRPELGQSPSDPGGWSCSALRALQPMIMFMSMGGRWER